LRIASIICHLEADIPDVGPMPTTSDWKLAVWSV
jgi:hypothetical protein